MTDPSRNINIEITCNHIFVSTYERVFKKKGFTDIKIFKVDFLGHETEDIKSYYKEVIEDSIVTFLVSQSLKPFNNDSLFFKIYLT